MWCENRFCLYNEDYECYYEGLELGRVGECKNCTYVIIQEDQLRRLKNRTLELLGEKPIHKEKS